MLGAMLAACSTGSTGTGTGLGTGGQTTGTRGTGGSGGVVPADLGLPQVSRSIQLSADGTSLWVVNTESDSISEIDVASRTLVAEILLAAQPAEVSDAGRFDPAVRPRSLALVDSLHKVYVAGQAANQVMVVDAEAHKLLTAIPVGADPVSVVSTSDGKFVYAVSHEAATVSKIDTASDSVVATLPVGQHPWGASLRADGSLLYVTQFLLDAAVTVIDTATFTVTGVTPIPDQPPDPSQNTFIPNGQVRGVYAAVPRPNSGEIWTPHLLLATGTAEPALVFNNTVFPSFTLLEPGGLAVETRLNFQPPGAGGPSGAFGDVISGPRDIAFTPDGALALVANAQSEDVMVFDANQKVEVGFVVRPIPSAFVEGIVVDATGTHAYLQGRNTHDVTVLDISESAADAGVGAVATVDTAGINPIECLAGPDPMPADYRHGQRLFYSSNSAAFPITQDFWVACATCHLEGQTDAVTWKFVQGPRDTPSNAGGPINTGFLFRQAVRNSVVDYDETIRVEQGGSYSRTDPAQQVDLQAIADFVNYAIPFPQNPNREPDGGLTPSQANGKALFVPCTKCHCSPELSAQSACGSPGDFYTDSGDGNPTLDLGGTVALHDMTDYTCVVSPAPFPDEASTDIDGGYRSPCSFDTPTLRGIFATAPYFHDGSAPTLDDAVRIMEGPARIDLSDSDRADLVAYLMTL